MNREPIKTLFRLCRMTRVREGISCVVSVQDAPPDDTGSQRIVYHGRDSAIDYERPDSFFTPSLRQNEDLLKKILSICVKAGPLGDIDIPFVFPEKRETRSLPKGAIRVFTDGSLSKSGTGGWAGVILYPRGKVEEKTGHEPCSTSNRTELLAVARTLESIESDAPAVVHTDSRYVIRGAEVWLANWEQNGFFTAQNRPVKNRDLWESVSIILNKREVHFRWVPSSGDDPHHRRCDILSRAMSLSPA